MGAVVTIGDLEIFLPKELTDFELERGVGEPEKDFQRARAMYTLLFSAARLAASRSGREHE
jgi:hypothetical protein